jgi:hypothetical protein
MLHEGKSQGVVNNSIVEARLAMLPFAVLLWLVGRSLRFLPIPIKNPFVRIFAQLTFAALIVGDILGQMTAYRSLSGIRGNLNDDNVFFTLFIGECVVGLCLMFYSAFALRRKERNKHGK